MADEERRHPFGEPVTSPPLPHHQPTAMPLYLDEGENKALERLIQNEPDITKMVRRQQAWGMVWDILIKIAGGLTAISAGLIVVREILKGAVK